MSVNYTERIFDMSEYIPGVIGVIILVWLLFQIFPGRPKELPRRERNYPRIVAGDGVWVAEINDFENAIVDMSPTTHRIMPMKEAKNIAEDAR